MPCVQQIKWGGEQLLFMAVDINRLKEVLIALNGFGGKIKETLSWSYFFLHKLYMEYFLFESRLP
jgi:hypothetical protein